MLANQWCARSVVAMFYFWYQLTQAVLETATKRLLLLLLMMMIRLH